MILPAPQKQSKEKNLRLNPDLNEIFALFLSQYSQSKKAGFYWRNSTQILEKIKEETTEVAEALEAQDQQEVEKELGDLLHAVLSLCSFLEMPAQDILLKNLKKYQTRFDRMLDIYHKDGGENFQGQPIEALLLYWNKAKKIEDESY